MDNPFRSQLWQQTIKEENKLYSSEFCMSMNNSNGTFVRLEEINEMISDGVLTVDFDKLEQRIFDRTVVKCSQFYFQLKRLGASLSFEIWVSCEELRFL